MKDIMTMRDCKSKVCIANIKLALFDFDDTLAIHQDKDFITHRKERGKNNYYRKAFENPDTFL